MYYFKSYDTDEPISLLPCFCGGEPKVEHKGNNYRKKKSITIKCKKCRLSRTDATLNHDFAWVEKVAADNWNWRPDEETINPKLTLKQYTAVTCVVHGGAKKMQSQILQEAYEEIERAYAVFYEHWHNAAHEAEQSPPSRSLIDLRI
jgi:hypothetical protein